MRRLRLLLANVALAAVSLAAALLLAEVAARLLLRGQGGGKEQDEASQYMEHDPRLGWRKRPGARATYRRREYTTDIAINRLGQRDPERADPPAAGTFRVLALGDSFVEGYTVPVEATATQVAERALGGPGCPVEVLNGGTAAWSTDQEYLYFQEAERLRPRVVLVFFYYNDLFGNTTPRYWGSPKPRLAAVDGRLVITNEPVPRPDPPDPAAAGPAPGPRRHRGSVALEWVRGRLARGAPRLYNVVARTGLWETLGGDTIERGDQLRVYKNRRGQADVEEAWTLAAAILSAFREEAEARGARFAAVYVPSRMEVSDRDWELTRLSYDLNESVWDRDLVRRRLEEVGTVAGFPVFDLTPALRAAAGPLRDVYFTHDGHWTAAGHEAVGVAVAEFLRGRGWVPACAASSPR